MHFIPRYTAVQQFDRTAGQIYHSELIRSGYVFITKGNAMFTTKYFRRAILLSVAMAFGFGGASTFAGTVVLKNGDKLSGRILAITPATVAIKTAYAGTVRIAIANVKTMAANRPVYYSGAGTPATMATVATAANGTGWTITPIPTAVPPVSPLAAKPVTAAPKPPVSWFGPDWENELDLGLVETMGNTNSLTFNGALNFHYHHKADDVKINFLGAYGKTNGTLSQAYFNTNEIWRHQLLNFKPTWAKQAFLYAENNNLYDGVQGISIRSLNSAGVGYYILQSKKMELDVRGGPGYTYEKFFHGGSLSYINGTAGLHFMYRLNKAAKFTESATYSTSLENAYNYVVTSNSSLDIALSQVARGLGLKFSYINSYDNTAGGGTGKRDNQLLLASLAFKF